MYSRYLKARHNVILNRLKDKTTEDHEEPHINPSSKKVYYFVDGIYKGFFDSITLCATTLGMSRPMVKKAIDNGTELPNGFVLKLTNK